MEELLELALEVRADDEDAARAAWRLASELAASLAGVPDGAERRAELLVLRNELALEVGELRDGARSAFGRAIYAVGGNPNAAPLSGLNVRRVQFMAFVIAGLAAGIGGVLMAARLNSGSPNYGVGLELSAIAAAVIGGASLAGGRGNIINTCIGALTIVIVQNGLNLNAVPTSVQTIVIGAIIVVAVGIDMWRSELGGALQRLTGFNRT